MIALSPIILLFSISCHGLFSCKNDKVNSENIFIVKMIHVELFFRHCFDFIYMYVCKRLGRFYVKHSRFTK